MEQARVELFLAEFPQARVTLDALFSDHPGMCVKVLTDERLPEPVIAVRGCAASAPLYAVFADGTLLNLRALD